MKKSIYKEKLLSFAASLMLIAFAVSSCEKDSNGIPSGAPSSNPVASKIAPDSAAGGAVLTLTGSGLFGMQSILFARAKDTVPASFNQNFNTDNNLVFRVPDTAYGGVQNIIFINSIGKQVTVPFRVLALPSVTAASSYSFRAGDTITLTGNNLDDVNSIALTGTTDKATVVSQSRKTLVMKMPASAISSATLTVTNSSGTITTTQEIVNADKAFVFFRDNYENGFSNNSWGSDVAVVTSQKVSGKASLGFIYKKGNWHNYGFGGNQVAKGDYNYLSFWIKGGLIDHDIFIYCNQDNLAGNDQAYIAANKIVVKANTWQYFKLPLSSLTLWAPNTTTFNKLGWSIKGPDNADESMNLDDVMFIK